MRTLFLMGLFWGTMPLFYIDPFYGIVHYTLINILRPEQLLWGGGVGRIYLAAQLNTFLAWLFNKDSKKLTPEYTPVPFQIKLMCLITIGMIISTVFGIAPKDWSWRWTTQFMKAALFCFLMSKSINTSKKLEWYYVMTLIWLMLLQLWGIQQKLGGNERMEGLGGDQLSDVNDLASIAVLYFPMAYYSLYSRKKWIKLLVGIPATIVSVIFILFGGSRGAAMGLAACMLFIFLRTPGFQKIRMSATLVIVGGLLAIILNAVAPEGFFDEYTARLKTIFGEEDTTTGEVEREASSASRIAMWNTAYHLFRQHPEFWMTGVGMAGFPMIYIQYIDNIEPYLTPEEYEHVVVEGRGGRAIHNTYINVITGGGILTFLPWLFLLFYACFQAHNIPLQYPQIVDGVNLHNYANAVEIGLMGAYISITFINCEFHDFYYWHMTMAGIIANIGKMKLRREELGQEDEYFTEETVGRPMYSPSPY